MTKQQNKTKTKTKQDIANVCLMSHRSRPTAIITGQCIYCNQVLQLSNQKWKPCKIRGDTSHHDHAPGRWKFCALTHLSHEYASGH